MFAEDAVLESTTGPVNFDVDKLYEGQLEGIRSAFHSTRTIPTCRFDQMTIGRR